MSAADPPAPPATTRGADFDLHGLVGIRLLDASPADVAMVRRQLGPLQRPLDREPDITVRFVDRATTEPMRYVGLGTGGFNADGFHVLRGRGGDAPKATIPFDRIGQRPEIRCETRMPAVPHLLAIINLTAAAKGVLALHASAFTMHSTGHSPGSSTGVLVTGWSKAGKTEALLGCMSQGAEYVGDEWVYLPGDETMLGLPEPIRLWSWHLHQVPHLLRQRPRGDRMRLSAWHRAEKAANRAADTALPGAGLLQRGAPVIGRQAYLQVPPDELFGAAAVALRGRLDAVVLLVNHEAPQTVVEPVDGSEVSARMAASLATERASFMDHYHQFRYAFPGSPSPVVEAAEATDRSLLSSVLDGRPAAQVLHPYPCDLAELGRAVLSGAKAQAGGGRRRDQGPVTTSGAV